MAKKNTTGFPQARLLALRKLYRMNTPHLSSKGAVLEMHKARRNKKKLPAISTHRDKPSEYKKMSIDDFEKKYLNNV